MSGPIGMMIQHDLRDWAQRQAKCHDYLLHGSKIIKDGWWQLNCDLQLKNPPEFIIEKEVSDNKFYLFIEKTWHNNHHAYPGSAMLGLYNDEPDPGWWVLNALHNLRIERVPEDCKVAKFLRKGTE